MNPIRCTWRPGWLILLLPASSLLAAGPASAPRRKPGPAVQLVARIGSDKLRHPGRVTCLAYSPDGTRVASGGDDGTIRIWDPRSGRETCRILPESPSASIGALCFSPDGKQLAATGSEKVWVWKLDKGRTLRPGDADFQVEHKTAFKASIFPSGHKLMIGTMFGSVELWDLDRKECLSTFGFLFRRRTFACSPDGKMLAVPEDGGEIHLWDVGRHRRLSRLRGHSGVIEALAFAPDGKSLFSAGNEGTWRSWDVATGKERRCLKGLPSPGRLILSSDGATLIHGGGDGILRVWSCSEAKQRRQIRVSPNGIAAFTCSPDGKTLAATGADESAVRLWDLRSGKELHPAAGHRGGITALAFSPRADTLLTASFDATAQLWDIASGKSLHCFAAHTLPIQTATYFPDGHTLATGARDGTIRLWDARSGKQLRCLRAQDRLVNLLTHCGPRDLLLSYGSNGVFRLWSPATGKQLRSWQSAGRVNAVSISPDGKQAAVAEDNWLQMYSLDTGKARLFHSEPVDAIDLTEIEGVAFSADGRSLVTITGCLNDRRVSLYEVASGQLVMSWNGSRRKGLDDIGLIWREGIVFLARGRLVAWRASHGTIGVWDTSTDSLVATLDPGAGEILSLAASRDGRYLASGHADSTAVVWRVADRFFPKAGRRRPLTRGHLPPLWDLLRSEKASEAHTALWLLIDSPESTVPFLKEQLHPVKAADEKLLARWIAALSSDRYAARQEAFTQLKQLGDLAVAALRKRLQTTSALDEKRQIERLLAAAAVWSRDDLRHVRALQVLERIGTPAARTVLERLAKEGAEARRTREAAAAVKRLQALERE